MLQLHWLKAIVYKKIENEMATMMSHWFCHQRAHLHCKFFCAIGSGNSVT